MTTDPRLVEVTLESDLKNVEVAEEITRRVATTAGIEEEEQHKVEMAVHESMINAIWHGNKNDPSKQVWLRFQIFGDRLEIHVRDQGNGFDPKRVADPLSDENLLKVSGRGIFLIRSFVDEFHVNHVQGSGTEVTLIKWLSSNNRPSQGGTDREHEGHSKTS